MKAIGISVRLVLVLSLVLTASAAVAGEKVSGQQARTLVDGGATLLDVRTDAEFEERHIEGAAHIPLAALPERLDQVGEKDDEIVLYCATGNRSGQAAVMLKNAGFTNVYDLGGIDDWDDE